jgi:hypothetical protein
MATITKRRRLIPRQRPADPTPAPAAVEPTRPRRISKLAAGTQATATCGCAGVVRYTFDSGCVRLLILAPCTAGGHERWGAGCTGGFPGSQVAAVVDNQPQMSLFPLAERTAP